MKQPYIKPTRFKHDSGFRTFEVGYILKMSDDNKVLEKEVLGNCSDHVYQEYSIMIGKEPFCINMDLTMDGYIRLFVYGKNLQWENDTCLSSMGLIIKE